MNSPNKGFTLIELLVVIAIIGILSSVVLASLNTARGKGADAAIKSDLTGIRSQAEIYRDTNATYGVAHSSDCVTGAVGMLVDPQIAAAITHALQQNGSYTATTKLSLCKIDDTTKSYAVAVTLKSDQTKAWCVDNSGASKSLGVDANKVPVITAPVAGSPYICS